MQLLSDGRFILGLGSGENLNEHVTGEGWPPIGQRQDVFEEAVTIKGPGSRKIDQIPISWGPDRDEAIDRAHDQSRWFGGG